MQRLDVDELLHENNCNTSRWLYNFELKTSLEQAVQVTKALRKIKDKGLLDYWIAKFNITDFSKGIGEVTLLIASNTL